MASSCRKPLELFYSRFVKEIKALPLIGVELEFYLMEEHPNGLDCFPGLELLLQSLLQEGISLEQIKKEEGGGQFEAIFPPTFELFKLLEDIEQFKKRLISFCIERNIRVSFEAKPRPHEMGSGMHINISLWDLRINKNLFAKDGSSTEETTITTRALAGLLQTMSEAMVFFCPNQEALTRFVPHVNVPFRICWGGNNRTVALRLPDSTAFPEKRRIEHRVPSANADPCSVIFAVMAGMYHGVVHGLPLGPKVHGNAFMSLYEEPPYSYQKFPEKFEECLEANRHSGVLRGYGLWYNESE